MIEYTTENTPECILSHRGNVLIKESVNIMAGNSEHVNKVGRGIGKSVNYAGTERTVGGLREGLIENFIGDKRISYIFGGCRYL